VRCTIVCNGAAQILETLDWILQSGLRPCRVKNKFAMSASELVGGYRDLMVCLLFEDPSRQAIFALIGPCIQSLQKVALIGKNLILREDEGALPSMCTATLFFSILNS